MALSQLQFAAAQDKIDAVVRAAKRGTPERATADALNSAWEAALALPARTAADRDARLLAIEAFASANGLVAS
jgi:hypothetical protein